MAFFAANITLFVFKKHQFLLVEHHSKDSILGNITFFITRSLIQKLFRSMNCQLLAVSLEKVSWCLNIPSEGGDQVSTLCPFPTHPRITAAWRTGPVTTGLIFLLGKVSVVPCFHLTATCSDWGRNHRDISIVCIKKRLDGHHNPFWCQTCDKTSRVRRWKTSFFPYSAAEEGLEKSGVLVIRCDYDHT